MEIKEAMNESIQSKVKETPAADLVMSLLLMVRRGSPRPRGSFLS
jgi:hypothetical protein